MVFPEHTRLLFVELSDSMQTNKCMDKLEDMFQCTSISFSKKLAN